MESTAGIRLVILGKSPPELPYEVVASLSLHSSVVASSLASLNPDAVLVLGEADPPLLAKVMNAFAGVMVFKYPAALGPEQIVQRFEADYEDALWEPLPSMASVYTPSFNTGDYLDDTYESLRDQTDPNWEWVVVDDMSSDKTWDRLLDIAKKDPRVRPFRLGRHSGRIGELKDTATRLCRGDVLIELDHDDMLAETAVEEIRDAFVKHPEVGFVYSNCCSFFDDGTFHRYDDEFWKKRYRVTSYRGQDVLETIQPNINDRFGPEPQHRFAWFLTVGPNHVRAFRRSTLFKLGGYNPRLPVADDWDLFVRFFLHSKTLLLDRLLYFYRFRDGWSNTTFTRNKAIQDYLRLGRRHHEAEFCQFDLQDTKPPDVILFVDARGIANFKPPEEFPAVVAVVHPGEHLDGTESMEWDPALPTHAALNACILSHPCAEIAVSHRKRLLQCSRTSWERLGGFRHAKDLINDFKDRALSHGEDVDVSA